MGQKVNPIVFRLGFKSNLWCSNYLYNNYEELSLYVYQDNEIKNYIYKFFKHHKLLVHSCKIMRSKEGLNILVSYFVGLKSISIINSINLIQKIFLNISKKNYKKKKKIIRRLWVLYLLKKKLNTAQNFYKNFDFTEQLLECLTLFTKKTLNINLILQSVSSDLFLKFKNKSELECFKKIFLKLRTYSNALFFKECLNILNIVIKKKNSARLISEFLAFQFSVMKKHNYFLNFLKRALILTIKSKFSRINGLKLLIKGRLNGKPRSKSRFLMVGKIPLQTINSKINYATSVSFSQYGTFGFKVWICSN
jgi:ribosomal protein S3